MLADYRLTSLSVGLHPLELLRPHLPGEVLSSAELEEAPHGTRVAVAGLAVARQRPATASGVVFMLIEDEHGQVNLIVPPPVYDRYRALVRGEPLLLARGRFERVDRNRNVLVSELVSLAPLARRAADDAEVAASTALARLPCPGGTPFIEARSGRGPGATSTAATAGV
jgi:error-prone DNA polymerase